jgi:putative spermidine/putrescine transport system substrate-binding protein
MITRRGLLGSVGALGLATTWPSLLSAQSNSLTFAAWGGTVQDAQKVAWADPFTAATGIQVIQDGPMDYGKLKAQVESGNVTWDVCDVQGPVAYQLAKDGMLEPIDFGVVDKAQLDPRFTFEYGVGAYVSNYVLGYNKSDLKDRLPRTWVDFFDTKAFPGKRAFYKWMSAAAFEIPLLADGVPADKLYPYDIDRAFAKLQTIKKDIIWWSTGAQSQQLLASGETPIGMFWNGRIYQLQEESGAKVGISWYHSTPGSDILVIPKGSKNVKAAMRFLAVATGAKEQAAFANATAYVPMNRASVPLLKKQILPFMPFGNNETEIKIDLPYLAENWAMLAKRWYAWQAAS